MKKIMFISDLFPPYVVGGTDAYLKTIVDELSSRGYETIVVSSVPWKKLLDPLRFTRRVAGNAVMYEITNANFFHESLFASKKSYAKFVWRILSFLLPIPSIFILKSIIEQERPDLIHTHNLHSYHPLLFRTLRKYKIPRVHTLHDFYLLCPRVSLLHRNGNLCAAGVESGDLIVTHPKTVCMTYRKIMSSTTEGVFDVVLSPSAFVLNKHRDSGFFSDSELKVLQLGIPQVDLPTQRRTEKDPKTVKFLYVGGLTRVKGVHMLLQAIKNIHAGNVIFYFAGEGDLHREIESVSKVDQRVVFLGFVSGKVKQDLFRSCHCLVVPSTSYENSPVVIYESFSHGLPVIASRIGGIPELIEHGVNGLLFSPNSVDQLAEAIQRLVTDESLLCELSRNALRAGREYLIRNHVDRLLTIYENVVTVKLNKCSKQNKKTICEETSYGLRSEDKS
jgi:glycosyltransferase involved in cell wall biosynthesis